MSDEKTNTQTPEPANDSAPIDDGQEIPAAPALAGSPRGSSPGRLASRARPAPAAPAYASTGRSAFTRKRCARAVNSPRARIPAANRASARS